MSPSSRYRALRRARYPKRATASDLRRVYAWNGAGRDESGVLSRADGYEVLTLINDIAALLDLRTRANFTDLEDLVHACPHAETDAVRDWVLARFAPMAKAA